MKQIKLFRLGQKKGKINFRFVCDDGSESKKKNCTVKVTGSLLTVFRLMVYRNNSYLIVDAVSFSFYCIPRPSMG